MSVDYFLKIDGIPGEASDAKHKGEIDILSWSWGEAQSGQSSMGGGAGAGKVVMQDFQITMQANKSSPSLFFHCATGKHIKSAVLTCRIAGGKQEEFMKLEFTDLLVSSFQTAGSGGDSKPMESVSFNFATIKYVYAAQKSDGSLESPIIMGYDIKQNTKI